MIYKPQLIDRVWKKVNVGRTGYKERLKKDDIELIINTLLSEMSQCMIDGEEIILRGFGKFASNMRKERIAFDSIHRQKGEKRSVKGVKPVEEHKNAYRAPHCSECEFMKMYDYKYKKYYCDHEKRIDDMGSLGENHPPKISPAWCPLKEK